MYGCEQSILELLSISLLKLDCMLQPSRASTQLPALLRVTLGFSFLNVD